MCALVSAHGILKLPVHTESGVMLGHVSDIEFDVDDMHVENIRVKPAGFSGILKEELLVHRTEILRIESDRVIVVDTLTPKAVESKQPSADPA